MFYYLDGTVAQMLPRRIGRDAVRELTLERIIARIK